MNNSLKLFYENQNEREAVRVFLLEALKEIAVEKTFAGEETTGIKEAKDMVDRLFNRLDEMYGKIQEIRNITPR